MFSISEGDANTSGWNATLTGSAYTRSLGDPSPLKDIIFVPDAKLKSSLRPDLPIM